MKHRILLSLLMLLLTVATHAQQITVKKFGQANQFIPSENQLRDWDNEPCALVKIQGAKIDSVSGAFEVIKHSAETWAYMTNGDRRLTIYKQGYEPKEVTFSSFGVDDVKGNKVYLMTIYAPELSKQRLFIGLRGGLNFTTNTDLGAGYSSADMMTGFHIGANVRYMFSDMFGVTAGVYFSTRGYKYSDVNIINEKGDFQFFDIPVLATLHFDLSDAVAVQVLAGPYMSMNVGGKIKADFPYTDNKFSDQYSAFQMGGQLGTKLIFIKHIALGIDYQLSFGNYKSSGIDISVGYIF